MSDEQRMGKDWVLGEITSRHEVLPRGSWTSNMLVIGVVLHASMGQETRTWRSSAGWQMPGWDGANDPSQVAKILRALADELDEVFE